MCGWCMVSYGIERNDLKHTYSKEIGLTNQESLTLLVLVHV